MGDAKPGLPDAFEHLGTEHFGQCLVTEQVLALFAAPTALLFVDGTRRHHQMHVRMIIESARMRVQYRDRTCATLQMFIVLTEGVDRLPRALGNQAVDGFLILPRQLPPLLRQSEGDHKIVTGKLFGQLPLYPLLGFVGLTVRTITVAARMRNEAGIIASAALHFHLCAQGVAAGLECSQCTALAGQKRVAVLEQEVGLKGFDDAGKPYHLTLPQPMLTLPIMELMHSMAASLLPVVRWV